jgi:membrane protein
MSARRGDPRERLEKLPPPRPTLLHRLTARVEQAGVRGWVERARRRSAALDAAFETIEHDSEIGGGMLAGALSYRLFVFALPFAFFLVSGLGLLANAVGSDPNALADSVGLAGVIAKQVASASESSNWWITLSAFLVLVYATRVLLRAVAIVHALAWERSAASVRVGARPLAIFGAAVICQVGLVAAVGAINRQTAVGGILAIVAFALALGALWLLVSLRVAHANARWTDLIPGALFYAFGVILIVLFNILILDRLLEEKSSTYGALGMSATLLLGFFLIGRVIVGAAVLNATLYNRHRRTHDDKGSKPSPKRIPRRAAQPTDAPVLR